MGEQHQAAARDMDSIRSSARPLWTPSPERVAQTRLARFIEQVNRRFGTGISSYDDLYNWSVNDVAAFWAEFWEFGGIIASQPFHEVIDDTTKMPGARWFSGARLNFAENLLRYRDDRTALVFRGEDKVRRTLSYAQLYGEVAKTSAALRGAGVEAGDRVVGFMPNMPETVIAMLGATAIGATWSSCSPDFGTRGVLDRFGQTRPKVLFTGDGYYFKGKSLDSLKKVGSIAPQLPSVEKIVVVPYTSEAPNIAELGDRAILWNDFHAHLGANGDPQTIDFAQLPFSQPVYIMYSSGTTGLPKCMVQSAGGVLINQLKEHMLHTDLRRDDTIFYFTTCGWMMWNWLVAALGVGATVVLYDGNPFHPGPDALWRMAEEEEISVFGTSASYIAALKAAGVRPKEIVDLTALRALLSTGSPLSREDFHFIYEQIKADMQLASISGGSDLNGCFALGNPMGPVYAGELQCRGLGMKVFSYDDEGKPVVGQKGELVCTAPFPSMPVYFWDDPDGGKYRAAYFERFPGIWTHGDFVEVTERGGLIMYGRSDATLNPGGVRIGTAEIYRIMEQIPEVADSVVIGQRWNNDVRVVLFVKLKDGVELTEKLEQSIRAEIRQGASPRHVPARIVPVADIPYTLNMKKVEMAVHKVVHGEEVTNRDALKNPEALELFADLPQLQE